MLIVINLPGLYTRLRTILGGAVEGLWLMLIQVVNLRGIGV